MLCTNTSARRAEKDKFYNELQQALATIPSDQSYVILGDFNARVGSRGGNDDPWCNVRGPHGYGESNDAGRELLAFLETNVAFVCNTWFEKKERTYTSKHGSIPNQSGGTVSTSPSCGKVTAKGAWMLL